MKKLLIATSLATLPLLAHQAYAVDVYVEAQAGYARLGDIRTENIVIDSEETIRLTGKYENDFIYGLELGLTAFESYDVLRIGLGWQRMSAELDKLLIQSNTRGAGSITADELETAVGISMDNDIDLFSANIYYDFPTRSRFKPYLGLGAGLIDLEGADGKESGWIYSIGARYLFSETIHAGFKYQHIDFGNFRDDFGVRYNGIDANIFSLTFGLSF